VFNKVVNSLKVILELNTKIPFSRDCYTNIQNIYVTKLFVVN